MNTPEDRPELDDKPPILGSWRNVYAVVIGSLVVFVILFAVITRIYS